MLLISKQHQMLFLCYCLFLQRVKSYQRFYYLGLHYQSLVEESISYHTVTWILTHQLTQFTHCCLTVTLKTLLNYSCLVNILVQLLRKTEHLQQLPLRDAHIVLKSTTSASLK